MLFVVLLDGWRHWRRIPCQLDEGIWWAIIGGIIIEAPLLALWLYCRRDDVIQ